jgi:NADPH:quinone reductase-like Zn-dependent oxidoreductase
MRGYRLDNSGSTPVLIEADIPQPKPGPGQLLVRVRAAGVTTAELSWYPTTHDANGQDRKGAVPSHEFSGVVETLGDGVEEFAPGQDVFGMNDWYSDGAMAEFCVAPTAALARKPEQLSHAEAASVPISALTAWQGLMVKAKVQQGDRVLIHGGAGAVGGFAIQIARLAGARVTTTTSAANLEFAKSLGAEQAIDYRASRFEAEAAGMDVVFDTVGGETLERSWGVLKPGGRMVTVASDENPDERTKRAFFIVEPSGVQLQSIAGMLQDGRLRTVVDVVVPWSRVPEAYTGKVKRNHRGKIVVAIDGPE